jgi:hypothetical protein
MGKYISGIASKANLDKWAGYAKSNSVDVGPIEAQSKRYLAPCKTSGRENDYIVADDFSDWQVPQQKFEGNGAVFTNDAARRSTYTKGGKRGY